MSELPIEYCCICGHETGHAGRADDSMPTNLPPAIDALLSAGARRFTVPMDPQPPCEIFDDGTGRWYPSGIPWGGEDWFAPYPPGTVLPVREEWRPVVQQAGTGVCEGTTCGLVEYRADAGNLLACKVVCRMGECPKSWSSIWWGSEMPDDGWQPAETMPDWAARRHVVVTECRPVRVGDVKDIYAIRDLGLDVGGLVAGFEIETYEDEYDDPGAFCGAAIDLFREWYARHFPGTTLESWAWMVSVEPKGESNAE